MVAPVCRCRVPDWRSLRLALALTQEQMAPLLGMGRSGYLKLELTRPHYCPRPGTMQLFRSYMRAPARRAALAAAGYAWPYAEDGEVPHAVASRTAG